MKKPHLQMLGCTLQARKPCSYPASRLKKETETPPVYWIGGSYISEAKSYSDIPPCAAEGRQDLAAVFHYSGEKEATTYRGH